MTNPTDVVLFAELAVDASKVTPGVLGFAVVALLGVATWLLIRSMNRQLRKIDFEETDRDDTPEGPGAGAAPGDDAGGGRDDR